MKGNFAACLEHVLKHEGGWADHPRDPGGATMRGVTLATYRAFKGRDVSKEQLRAISHAEIEAIYRAGYWDKIRGDDLPIGVDLVAFDAAVNSGPKRGAQWLQQAAGVTQDGAIGPKTLEAIATGNPRQIITAALDARLQFLRGLSTFSVFGRGWTARVADVRAEAMAMLRQPAEPAQEAPVGFWAAITNLFNAGR